MSGPEFLAVYAVALLVAGACTAASRARYRKSADGPSDAVAAGVAPDDVFTLAAVSGGEKRVVDTAVQALVEEGLLRVGRDHRITPCGVPASAEPVRQAVLAGVDPARGADLAALRDHAGASPAVRQVVQGARARGLLLTPDRRRTIGLVSLLPLLVVLAGGLARLVHGVAEHRPVLLLVLELVVTLVVLVAVASSTPRRTPAGERALAAARDSTPAMAGGPAAATDGHALPPASPAFAPSAVAAVALLGAAGIADATLRDALYGGLTSSGGGGSAGCGGSSGCGGGGGGGCGGGCGGCGG